MDGILDIHVSAVPLVSAFNRGMNTVGVVGGIVCMVQLVPSIGTIILAEAALKKTFDKNGTRR